MSIIVTGIVEKGKGYAGRLGFPTANIPLANSALSGIYAARVTIKEGDAPYMAAVFADPKRSLLEAYILDFFDDLVGREISIELYDKIRDTEVFTDETALKNAIAKDVEKTRSYFKERQAL